MTPPSVRFLGRKVYLGAIVILISAMRQGPTPRRVRELSARFGADRRTIARWQVFWREHFPQTPFWKVARARLVPVVEIVTLPYSLVDAFLRRHHRCRGWTLLLRFLSPITVPGGLADQGLAMIASHPQKMLFASPVRTGVIEDVTVPSPGLRGDVMTQTPPVRPAPCGRGFASPWWARS